MIFVEITAVFHTNTTNVKNMHLHRDSNPGPKSVLDKIGEHSITLNFDPQYFPKQPEVGHLPEFFFVLWTLRVEKSPVINVLSGWYLAQSEPGLYDSTITKTADWYFFLPPTVRDR